MKEKSLEQICRELLAVAVSDGLVVPKEGCSPEDLRSGDLVGSANLLNQVISKGENTKTISDTIVRGVVVNRARSPQEAIDATGRVKWPGRYCNSVVATTPQGEDDEMNVSFFKLEALICGKYGLISDDKVAEQYELRGFKPVDLHALASVNGDDPTFADDYPNCTYWEDENGKRCLAAFFRNRGERCVIVGRDGSSWWHDNWWFAGCRK